MDALDLLWHLANFVLPAVAVGAFTAALCKLFWRRGLARTSWFTLAWQASAAGLAVLVAGLVITGHDGRMITYAGTGDRLRRRPLAQGSEIDQNQISSCAPYDTALVLLAGKL